MYVLAAMTYVTNLLSSQKISGGDYTMEDLREIFSTAQETLKVVVTKNIIVQLQESASQYFPFSLSSHSSPLLDALSR